MSLVLNTNLSSLVAQNSLGAAASFLSGSSYPPFDVNSTKKVTNLNADQVDGIDSSGLIQGKGKVYTLAVSFPRGSNYMPSPAVVPAFANIVFECPPTTSSGAYLDVSNLSGGAINVFFMNSNFPSAHYYDVPAGGTYGFSTREAGDITTITIQGQPPSTGLQTVTTATVSTLVRDFDCHFQIQALTTTA